MQWRRRDSPGAALRGAEGLSVAGKPRTRARVRPLPKCVICGGIKASHHPNSPFRRDCTGWVAPEPEQLAAAASEARPAAGRPPASAARERTPSRRGKLGSDEQKRAKQMLGIILAGLDNGAHAMLPKVWTAEDKLKADEAVMLVGASYDELEALAPDVLRWLAEAAASSVHISFAWAIAMVAVPRLERRGIVPEGTTTLITLAPFYMAAGGAPVRSGPDRNGQEHPPRVVAAAVDVPDGTPDEVGFANGAGL